MPVKVKLVHPIRGILLEEMTTSFHHIKTIKQKWINLYGKAIVNCSKIETENFYAESKRVTRPVVHIASGEVFNTIIEASRKLKVSCTLISLHANKANSIGFDYKFKFA